MQEKALYRKYRPNSFKDVLGQEHVVDVLENSIKQGNIAHAYIFSGSRGTGKTSTARIFAKEIGTSSNDLYEIDGASNRGIDDVRELREAVHILPFESAYKVYIIDEVHMLTKEAFNALLKTLEEPPAHVIFILATTEINKLPETVVSRCQTFTFKKPTVSILRQAVSRIAKKEGFSLETPSAELIALLGDGSFRDAQGILQKVIGSAKDKKISHSEVERITGAPRSEMVNSILQAIAESKLEQALKVVVEAGDANIDMKIFLKLLLHKMRAVLLLRFASELESRLKEEFSDKDFEFLSSLKGVEGAKISSSALSEMLKVADGLRYAYIQTIPLELALIRIIGDGQGGNRNSSQDLP